MSTIERTLQKLAEELDVNYYSSFTVLEVPGGGKLLDVRPLFFPMAEVYEQGSWRKLVIGGRPYHEELVARVIVEGAAKAQEAFLKAMSDVEKSVSCFHLIGLVNPIDHCKYYLEM